MPIPLPRLVAISGPLKGATFAPGNEDVTIGRDDSNRVVLDDLASSRCHCVIQKEGERFRIVDLKSRNRSFVNGVPITEKLLEHGDQIRIGISVFLFLADPAWPAEDSHSVSIDKGLLVTRTTAVLRSEDVDLSGSNHAARDLNAVFRRAEALNRGPNLEASLRTLLDAAFEIVPVDHGAVLFVDASAEPESSFAMDRKERKTAQIRVSPEVIGRAIAQRVGVIDECSTGLWSLAVPLICLDRAIGVLCLATASPAVAAQLDQDLLRLFAAIGAIAGPTLENARRIEQLKAENLRLRAEVNLEHEMVGESPAMRAVYQFISKVAPSAATVLIEGESGTGKELVARAIHRNSPREAGPFLAINCAALTESLLESELFGHERGAFTGAVALKKGQFEAAAGGTIFLDEIGELALPLQAKLLRVLEQHEFQRVGGTRSIHVDVRVVAATNRDLAVASKNGAFRQDLYFRLNVVSVKIPPLRERRQDISAMAEYFAMKSAGRCRRRVSGISVRARELLAQYDWPGNVRELENAIERAVVLGASDVILPEDLPEFVHEAVPIAGPAGRLHGAVQEAKRHAILAGLEQAGWNYTEAAKLLNVHPNYLHRLIQNMNLKAELRQLALRRSVSEP